MEYNNLSQEQQSEFRENLKNSLRIGEQTVKFKKADGSTRIMKCTLSESLIPEVKRPKINPDKPAKAPSDSACNVFDIEKQEWRSFRYDSLINE